MKPSLLSYWKVERVRAYSVENLKMVLVFKNRKQFYLFIYFTCLVIIFKLPLLKTRLKKKFK